MADATPLFRRVVVKLSGEALMGPETHGLHARDAACRFAQDLKAAAALNVQVAVVIGGGNFFPRIAGRREGHRARAGRQHRHAGDGDERAGDGRRARGDRPAGARALRRGQCLHSVNPIRGRPRFGASGQAPGDPAGGRDGQPVLHHRHRRGVARGGTVVRRGDEGDQRGRRSTPPIPKKDPEARRFERLSHDEAIQRNLQVMDTAAFALTRDNKIPIVVFSAHEQGAIEAALLGRGRATYVMP